MQRLLEERHSASLCTLLGVASIRGRRCACRSSAELNVCARSGSLANRFREEIMAVSAVTVLAAMVATLGTRCSMCVQSSWPMSVSTG